MRNYVKWTIFFVLFHQVRSTTQTENDQRKKVEKTINATQNVTNRPLIENGNLPPSTRPTTLLLSKISSTSPLINSLLSDNDMSINETEAGKTSLPPPLPHTTDLDCGPGYYLDDLYDCQPCSPGTMDIPACHVVDPCRLDPCKNGGTCDNVYTDMGLDMVNFTCQCPLPYIGSTCEVVDPCSSDPCKHGGNCIFDPSSKMFCQCLYPYTGHTCEETHWSLIPIIIFGIIFLILFILEILDITNPLRCCFDVKQESSTEPEPDKTDQLEQELKIPEQYDICIFYDDNNDKAHYLELIPKLEKKGLKILTPGQLVGGKPLPIELNDKIDNSTYEVVIVSKDTAIEGWLKQEIITSVVTSVDNHLRENCVVPILFNGKKREELPFQLANLRCLEFGDSDFENQLSSTFSIEKRLEREASLASMAEPSSEGEENITDGNGVIGQESRLPGLTPSP